jgi:hypothetical protein
MREILVGIVFALIVMASVGVHSSISAQDSTFFYGTLENEDGIVILKTQDDRHRLLFQHSSAQDEAKNQIGKVVKVLGRPGYIGKERPLIVVFVRPLEKK